MHSSVFRNELAMRKAICRCGAHIKDTGAIRRFSGFAPRPCANVDIAQSPDKLCRLQILAPRLQPSVAARVQILLVLIVKATVARAVTSNLAIA